MLYMLNHISGISLPSLNSLKLTNSSSNVLSTVEISDFLFTISLSSSIFSKIFFILEISTDGLSDFPSISEEEYDK